MIREERIQALVHVSQRLSELLDEDAAHPNPLDEKISAAFHHNGWFTQSEVRHALLYWADEMQAANLEAWTSNYPLDHDSLNVGLILAGNIPLVGWHDIISTLLSGHHAMIKPSSSDHVLIDFMLQLLVEANSNANDWFSLHPQLLQGFDAVIATGSNNSARYFEQYFGTVPHIIRRNRTSVAVLDGSETEAELHGLMEDALRYYGLGCRNVTKLFLPEHYDTDKIFAASVPFAYVMENKKYANNYAYHRTLMMMQKKEVLENEVILLTASESPFSPVSVLHAEYYENRDELDAKLIAHESEIQCIVGKDRIPFGSAQKPRLQDYADGVDTMEFLSKLKAPKASK